MEVLLQRKHMGQEYRLFAPLRLLREPYREMRVKVFSHIIKIAQ